MSQITLLRGQAPQSIAVGDAGAAFTNAGPDIVYYGGPTVSSGSSLGSIGVGSTVSLSGSPYLVLAPSAVRADLTFTAATGSGVGIELGAAQITTNPANITTTSFVAVTGLSVVVTTGVRPVRIEAFLPLINGNATLALAIVGLFRDGTQIQGDSVTLPANAQFIGWSGHPVVRDNPAGGSHTYDVRAKIGTAGQVVSGQAASTAPAFIQVVEV